ncbi:RNA polymerase sigma factor [Streptomyces europaeiscabiei]|uniref:RNA polymerase sigma factor n=1 Tax=Streptomyces europaeiscabiei TaxID=146819 RepID=UPI0019694861|nr:sigma-70 family RNA polymerase sigma factor [Streptomyces europaeiscabiei]
MRSRAYWLVRGADHHADDVCSKVGLAFYQRLLSGQLEGNVPMYLWRITVNHALTHLRELQRRAEDFVGDETSKLEDPARYITVSFTSKVELTEAMAVLEEEFSPLQRKVYVLSEAYDLKAPVIARLVGSTRGSVRDALRHARAKVAKARVEGRLGSDD